MCAELGLLQSVGYAQGEKSYSNEIILKICRGKMERAFKCKYVPTVIVFILLFQQL